MEVDAPWWDLLGGSEEALGSHFEVNAAAIRETLDTALFASHGPNRLGFFHSTYAEFLAARYLTQHDMSTSQIMNLISHSGDPESRLAPQQHGTAAWLAAMRSGVFRAVIKTDPDVMLRSDVSTATDSDRQELVSNLLHLYNEERLIDTRIGSRHLYAKLRHPLLISPLFGLLFPDYFGLPVGLSDCFDRAG